MNLQDIDIIKIIPQRPPFVMIDKLIYSDAKCGRGKLFIQETNLLCKNGFFREAGIIEFIAQTAAAHMGYFQISEKQKVREGYIGAVKNLIINYLPLVNTEIQSEIVVDTEIMGYTIVIGKVIQENNLLAECEMRIILDAK